MPFLCGHRRITVRHKDICCGILKHMEVGLVGHDPLHPLRIEPLVALCTRCANRRAAGGVQGLFLKSSLIRIETHLSAQGIKLIDEMAFGKTSDGRIAGHLCNGILPSGDEKGVDTHPGGDKGRLDPGMSTANHNQFEIFVHAAELYHYGPHLST